VPRADAFAGRGTARTAAKGCVSRLPLKRTACRSGPGTPHPSFKRAGRLPITPYRELPRTEQATDMNIEKFKQEHVDLLNAVTVLREFVQAGVQENADAICKQLMSMTSAIKLHLAAEDRMLYPALAGARDPSVAQIGKQFQQEMGGIAEAFAAFATRWNLASKIAASPAGFKDDANTVFKALHMRVQRENRELYPLAETI
jgi:hypothetical protein